MIRDVDLLSFLPEYMKEYREMKCLMMAEDPDVQKAEDATEDVKNNQFIQSWLHYSFLCWYFCFDVFCSCLDFLLESCRKLFRKCVLCSICSQCAYTAGVEGCKTCRQNRS